MPVNFAAYQLQGNRQEQEDSYRILRNLQLDSGASGDLFVLADGMGGHAHGAVASAQVCESFILAFKSGPGAIRERLHAALQTAHQKLLEESERRAAAKGMGATLVALWISGSEVWWISVGDSPLWLQRGKQLTRLNEDHSMAPVLQKMVELGQLSQQAADSDPKRHALRSSVGGADIKLIDCPHAPLSLNPGDRLLLATDGVEVLGHRLAPLLLESQKLDSQLTLDRLFQEIEKLALPEQDNASALLIQIDGEQSPAAGHELIAGLCRFLNLNPRHGPGLLLILASSVTLIVMLLIWNLN